MSTTSQIFLSALEEVPNDVRIQVNLSFDIADRIAHILESKGLSQKDFAALMHKTQAEISRWLSGTHNFTISTIAKIQDILGERILSVG